MRVVRAFKSNLEDLEDRRSIHSLRSLRNAQAGAQANAASLFYPNRSYMKTNQPSLSPSVNISIAVPTEPLNINSINARFMDDDAPDERNNTDEQSRDTRI